ncbi:MAG: tRNA (adenosine(37)-N6)-threonylcarbamoyltransferase complex transferase subunit TsaD [Anaerolineae bacterium]|nr:tRNA (adenosine(37)-N6)-threonylcarbamoyltransferase complex transferase subunit TsaD [Anaerolineae bacterium]
MNTVKFPPARVLGIETSCDETAAAVVENGRVILSNVVASQAALHAKYGGVFPEAASRQHIRTIHTVVEEALGQAHLALSDIDAIAVTRGPGLPGSLVVGVNMAKGLALGSGKPLIGINHLEGHLYSAWIDPGDSEYQEMAPEPAFPLLALLVSGGHTELVLMKGHLQYQRLGGTLDDAAGEAFDKVSRLLGLGYPGGPKIEKAAKKGDITAYKFPRAWLEESWDFSFSGLKTAVLRKVRELQGNSAQAKNPKKDDTNAAKTTAKGKPLPVADLAASFQEAVVDVLVTKTRYAAQEYQAQALLVAGGVSANQALRKRIAKGASGRVHIPPIELCTDNAAMIAAAGYYRFVHGQQDDLDMDVLPTWPLSEL